MNEGSYLSNIQKIPKNPSGGTSLNATLSATFGHILKVLKCIQLLQFLNYSNLYVEIRNQRKIPLRFSGHLTIFGKNMVAHP